MSYHQELSASYFIVGRQLIGIYSEHESSVASNICQLLTCKISMVYNIISNMVYWDPGFCIHTSTHN